MAGNVLLRGLSVLLSVRAIGFGAAVYRGWLRAGSAGILPAYAVLALAPCWIAPLLPAGQSLVGGRERTMRYGYLLWAAVFAAVLLGRSRTRPVQPAGAAGSPARKARTAAR